VGLVHASLIDTVLYQAADRIVRNRRDDRGVHPKAAVKAAGDIVFAAPFPNAEGARSCHAPITRIQSKHHFAQADQVPSANFFRFDSQLGHYNLYPLELKIQTFTGRRLSRTSVRI
jgi:hypothetical protein